MFKNAPTSRYSKRLARLGALFVTTTLAVVLAACAPSANGGSKGDSTLRVVVNTAPQSMNLLQSGSIPPAPWFWDLAYGSLIVRNSDGQYVPGLLTDSFRYTDSTNQVFEIKLRKGVKFSDGGTLDAAALKKWFEMYRDGNALLKQPFTHIKSVELVDDLTVRINLNAPDPGWPNTLSQDQVGFPISPKAMDNPNTLNTTTAGAGPYELNTSQTVSGQKYVYDKVPNYWDKSVQHWDQVVLTVVHDPNAALSSMQSGQADVMTGSAGLADAAQKANLTVSAAPFQYNALYLIDRGGELVKALGDIRVRQALQYAVDRDAVMKAVYGKYGQGNVSMVVQGNEAFSPQTEARYSYDPAKARQLLTEAGYPNGFELTYGVFAGAGPELPTFAQAVQAQLEKVGVKVNLITGTDFNKMGADLLQKKYPAFVFFGQIPQADPLKNLQLTADAGGLNPFRTDNPQLDALRQAALTASAAQRPAALQALQAAIVDQAWMLNVGVSDQLFFSTKAVTGVSSTNGEPIVNILDIRPAS